MFAAPTPNALFDRVSRRQYTKELTFGALIGLMAKVTFGTHESVHAAHRHSDDLPVSLTAVYDKLGRLETAVSEALVRRRPRRWRPSARPYRCLAPSRSPACVCAPSTATSWPAPSTAWIAWARLGAAALPGMSLVVRDGPTGLLTDLIACEDAYTGERLRCSRPCSTWCRADDLWLADRNFCTDDYLSGIQERRAYFLIRHHAGSKLEPVGEERFVGCNDGGDVYEGPVRIGGLTCRRIRVRLHRPLRDGSTEVRLLTNVPPNRAGATRLAELYRTRWHIETAFQELTEALRCEVKTLGYPKAALFAFALAVAAYNLLVLVRAALASGQGREKVERELSSYHLATEVAVMAEGLAVAVTEEAWERFARMDAAALAAWLHETAAGLNWARYRKSPRGPKKASEVKRTPPGRPPLDRPSFARKRP